MVGAPARWIDAISFRCEEWQCIVFPVIGQELVDPALLPSIGRLPRWQGTMVTLEARKEVG